MANRKNTLVDVDFKKSSASLPSPYLCVEVKRGIDSVHVKGTEKDETLIFTIDEWDVFTKGVKKGEFDIS